MSRRSGREPAARPSGGLLASKTPAAEDVPNRPSRRGCRRGGGGPESRVSEADASSGDQASTSDAFDTVTTAFFGAGEGAGRAQARGVHPSPARAAGRAKGRAQDRRARADGGRAAPRREVPRVLGRGLGRADPSRSRRDDLRVQAGRRGEVQQDHRPGRRPLSGDAGRVRPDRSHTGQVHGRHPDSQPESRADLPA